MDRLGLRGGARGAAFEGSVRGINVDRDGVAVACEEVDAVAHLVALLAEDSQQFRFNVFGYDPARRVQAGKDQGDYSGRDATVDQAADLDCPVDQVRVVLPLTVLQSPRND